MTSSEEYARLPGLRWAGERATLIAKTFLADAQAAGDPVEAFRLAVGAEMMAIFAMGLLGEVERIRETRPELRLVQS